MKRTGLGAWIPVVCALVLATGVGCSDDDDAGEAPDPTQSGGGTVSTNVAKTTNNDGSISLITNLVFKPNPVLTSALKLSAPKLIAPANAVVMMLAPGAQGATVKFEWEGVAGAEGYHLAYKGAGDSDFMTSTTDTSPIYLQVYGKLPRGTNYWKMAALKNGVPQTWSGTQSFIFK